MSAFLVWLTEEWQGGYVLGLFVGMMLASAFRRPR